MCMSFYAPPCGFDPLGPFQPSQTEVYSACKDRKFWLDHAKMLPSRLNCMISPLELGNLHGGRCIMNTPSVKDASLSTKLNRIQQDRGL